MSGGPARRVPRLHVITTREVLGRPDFRRVAYELLAAGDLALHLRAGGSSGRLLLEHALALGSERTAGRLLVNDRVDVARIAGTGAQLPEAGLTPMQARTILGREPLLGRSVHEPRPSGADDETAQCDAALLDFVIYGHVFATPSKVGLPPRGLAGLRRAVRRYAEWGLPVIAIGGITPERLDRVLEAGAHGAAAISGFWDGADPMAAVASCLETLAGRAGPPESGLAPRGGAERA
jgi:thiazole tautomerase (transcriptional regulator TenI)